MQLSLALAVVAALVGSAAAGPARLDARQAGDGQDGDPCTADSDCTTNLYCRLTPAQRASGDTNGVCTYQKNVGQACYKPSGCLSGNCNTTTKTCAAAQLSCTKYSTGTLYLSSVDNIAYQSLSPKPSQPYLTFNNHCSTNNQDGPNGSGVKEEVLTTSGPGHRLAGEFWQCAYQNLFDPSAYDAAGTFGQVRIPSRGGKCLTVSFPPASGNMAARGASHVYLAPCSLNDDASDAIAPRQVFDATDSYQTPVDGSSSLQVYSFAQNNGAGFSTQPAGKNYMFWWIDGNFQNAAGAPSLYLAPSL